MDLIKIKRNFEKYLGLESDTIPKKSKVFMKWLKKDDSFKKFQERPPMGYYLDKSFGFLYRLQDELSSESLRYRTVGQIEKYRWLKAFETTKIFKFTGWTIGTEGYSTWMNGRISIPGQKGDYSLNVVSLGHLKRVSKEDWRRGELSRLEDIIEPSWGTILVPSKTLTSDLVKEAVLRWYLDRFRWSYHHWTAFTKKNPKITFDMDWHKAPKGLSSKNKKAFRIAENLSQGVREFAIPKEAKKSFEQYEKEKGAKTNKIKKNGNSVKA